MTIITKPLSEKKEAKPLTPIVPESPSAPEDDVESQAGTDPSFIILRTRARRVSTVTTLCLLMTSLIVVGVGILAGTHLYRQYLRSQVFKGWAAVPYDVREAMYQQSSNDNTMDMNEYLEKMTKELSNELNTFQNTFREEFEIDTYNGDYEKITVPDFKDGRMGRFVHDFNNNKTGIIDISGKRCFIMPLDRNTTLPPRSLLDLVQKMWGGYYKVDTQIIREQYRVEIPPLSDDAQIGTYIAGECAGMPIYKLEKYVSGVWKRSAELPNEGKFAQFAGRHVVELDIMNFKDVEEYEKNL